MRRIDTACNDSLRLATRCNETHVPSPTSWFKSCDEPAGESTATYSDCAWVLPRASLIGPSPKSNQ